MSTNSSPEHARWRKIAWLTVALLVPVALLNYFDRQMVAAMKTSIMADIPSVGSDKNWGLMLGQFKWVYAFLSPIGGLVADRISRRWTITVSLVAWSAITWATGHATTFEQLLWARTAMGISEAFYIPAGLALIADVHSGATRARAVGFHQAAIYVGVILGGFSGHVADNPQLGWRFAFDAAGIAGIAYAFVLLAFLRDHKPVGNASPSETKPKGFRFLDGLPALLTNRSFLLMVLYFTLPALAGWVVRDWMPAILKDQFQIGQGTAGVSATLYTNIAALAAVFAGGWASDRLLKRSIRGRIHVSATGMALLIPALFVVGNAPTLITAVAGLALFGIGWGLFDGNNMPILSQVVPAHQRATAYGFMNLVSISAGGLADVGFGILRDKGVALNLIFTAFAATIALSVVLVLLVRPRPELSSTADTQPA
jgi:MFS family permease